MKLKFGSNLRQWWRVIVVAVLLRHVQVSSHLSKEFISPGKEAARSIEPERTGSSGDGFSFDVGAVLCEKYGDWSQWSPCSRKCEQTRARGCRVQEECGRSWVKEKRTCTREKEECSPLSYKVIGIQKRNRLIEEVLYDLLYSPWTAWGPCLRSCRQRRQRKCKYKAICIRSYIQEERRCQVPGVVCEHRFSLKPLGVSRENASTAHQEVIVTGGNETADVNEDDYNDGDDDSVLVGGGTEAEESKDSPLFGDNEDDEEDGESNKLSGATEEDLGSDSWLPSSGRQRQENTREEVRNLLHLSPNPHHEKPSLLFSFGKERKGATYSEEMTSSQKNCGIRPKQASGSYRVVGGQEVQKNSWPWQVAILTKYREQYCGGTLIAPRWVLTAAHCVQKKGKRRKLIVRIGEHDIDEFEPTQEDIRSEQEFPHPDFDYHTITNDIALVKLRHSPSVFTQPGYACLPSAGYAPPKDQLCTIVGWGKLKNTHLYGSSSLQEVQVPVVRQRKCERVFDYSITPQQVCAGYKKGGKDSCAGDSGGPLLCKWKDGDADKYVIYGVTSYGEGCGRKQKYGIYTKVASYRDWIDKTIRENT